MCTFQVLVYFGIFFPVEVEEAVAMSKNQNAKRGSYIPIS